MKEDVKTSVRKLLAAYLEKNNYRKTPERFAILDAVYSFHGVFTMQELNAYLRNHNFPVSRATLYNTMKLLMQLRLVIYQRTLNKTMFEASYNKRNHCHQICSVCGNIKEVSVPGMDATVENAMLKRFRPEGYSLYIYGICSSCQAKITRRIRRVSREKDAKEQRKQTDV